MGELIENGQNGFLVNAVDEAIDRVAHIKDIDRAFCRSHIERNFTVERMAKEYIKVYENILEKKNLEEC